MTDPAFHVTDSDNIEARGTTVSAAEGPRLWLYHKPAGLITSHKDEAGRPTVFASLPKNLPRVISVGRLDLNTEGLLLLTNNGHLARHMELPSTGWKRRYRVRVYGFGSPDALQSIANGVTIDGVRYGPVEVVLEQEKQEGKNQWAMVTIAEGKNREIRKVFAHIGCTVSRLIRVAYGPFQLGNLASGEVKEVPRTVLEEHWGGHLKKPSSS